MIYLASPYSDPSPAVRYRRFLEACKAAGRLMLEGQHVFSPIAHGHAIAMVVDLPTDFAYWKGYCHCMLSRCDRFMVLELPGWAESVGVAGELKMAVDMGRSPEFMKVSP